MASKHSTGFTYSLARNSCLNTSIRLECAICGRGSEFPRASGRHCLTFPHGVYSVHRLSSRSFSSPTRCTGIADSKLLMQLLYHGQLPTPPQFRFTVRGTNFVELCNILYTAGPPNFRPLTAALDSSRFVQGGGISLNSAMPLVFMHCKESTTSSQARTRFSRLGVWTLNQSTSRDGCLWTIYL